MAEDPSRTHAPSSLTRSTIHGVFWLTAGRFLKAPVSVLTVAVLARLLTPADFGVVAIAMLVVSLSNVIIDGSFGMVLIQRRDIDPPLIGASLLLSAALAVLFAAGVMMGAPLLEREFDFPHVADVLIVLGAILPITAVTTITTALLQRTYQFSTLALNGLVAQVALAAVAVGMAFAGMGLWSLVWAQVVSFIVEAGLGFLAIRSRFEVRLSRAATREVLSSGGMFTISKLLNWAANSVDRLAIGRLLGAAELGFYSRANSLLLSLRQLTAAGPNRVLFSTFAKIQHDRERMQRAYLRALSLSLIAAGLVSAFVVLNAELIVMILLGPQWMPTVPLMQILFAAFVARSGYVVAEAIPLALGLGRQSALRQGAQLVLILLGASVGARFGLVGAVTGIAIAYWIFYAVCLLLVQRVIHPPWLDLARVHLHSLLVALPPVAVAVATSWLLPSGPLMSQALQAFAFSVAALFVLAFAPQSLIGGDLVAARDNVWQIISRQLPRRRGRF